jgi:hypothetical protein
VLGNIASKITAKKLFLTVVRKMQMVMAKEMPVIQMMTMMV